MYARTTGNWLSIGHSANNHFAECHTKSTRQKKKHSAKNPLIHGEDKTLGVCRVYFWPSVNLLLCRVYYFGTWKRPCLPSAGEKTLGKEKLKSHFEAVN
jgi:hypothetical protein